MDIQERIENLTEERAKWILKSLLTIEIVQESQMNAAIDLVNMVSSS